MATKASGPTPAGLEGGRVDATVVGAVGAAVEPAARPAGSSAVQAASAAARPTAASVGDQRRRGRAVIEPPPGQRASRTQKVRPGRWFGSAEAGRHPLLGGSEQPSGQLPAPDDQLVQRLVEVAVL